MVHIGYVSLNSSSDIWSVSGSILSDIGPLVQSPASASAALHGSARGTPLSVRGGGVRGGLRRGLGGLSRGLGALRRGRGVSGAGGRGRAGRGRAGVSEIIRTVNMI